MGRRCVLSTLSHFSTERFKGVDHASTKKLLGTETRNSKGKSLKKPTRGAPPHLRPILAKRETQGALEPLEDPILEDVVQEQPRPPIAVLSHGLDRVLFNPGVHWLQDPRTRVYNFTPWLQSVPSVSDFDFNRIPTFVPSSRDDDLFGLAKRQGRRFAGSTSSLTGVLGQCYFLISGEKEVDLSVLSDSFKNKVRYLHVLFASNS